jgi:uncharacterized membrane protein
MLGGLSHIVWNVFLASIAVALSQPLASLIRAHRARRDGLLAIPMAIVFAAWLLMLPNTCYLFTEVRHLFEAIDESDLWARAHHSSPARWALVVRMLVVLAYAGVGALSFGVAIRCVRRALEANGRSVFVALPLFFAVVSLGVYLGLIERLNSWDALTHPSRVLADVMLCLASPRRALVVALGGVALWTVYEIVDVWIDGVALRTTGVVR